MSSSNARLGLIAAAIVGGVAGFGLLVLGGVLFFSSGGKVPPAVGSGETAPAVGWGGPKASREGEEWTVRDMVGHLQSKGVITGEMKVEYAIHSNHTGARITINDLLHFAVVKYDSANQAKDHISANDLEDRLTWGRFGFAGKASIIKKCRAALN